MFVLKWRSFRAQGDACQNTLNHSFQVVFGNAQTVIALKSTLPRYKLQLTVSGHVSAAKRKSTKLMSFPSSYTKNFPTSPSYSRNAAGKASSESDRPQHENQLI